MKHLIPKAKKTKTGRFGITTPLSTKHYTLYKVGRYKVRCTLHMYNVKKSAVSVSKYKNYTYTISITFIIKLVQCCKGTMV